MRRELENEPRQNREIPASDCPKDTMWLQKIKITALKLWLWVQADCGLFQLEVTAEHLTIGTLDGRSSSAAGYSSPTPFATVSRRKFVVGGWDSEPANLLLTFEDSSGYDEIAMHSK